MPWAGGSGSAAPAAAVPVPRGRAGRGGAAAAAPGGRGSTRARVSVPGLPRRAARARAAGGRRRVANRERAREAGNAGLLCPRLLAQVLAQAGRDLDHKTNLGLKIKLDFKFFSPLKKCFQLESASWADSG